MGVRRKSSRDCLVALLGSPGTGNASGHHYIKLHYFCVCHAGKT